MPFLEWLLPGLIGAGGAVAGVRQDGNNGTSSSLSRGATVLLSGGGGGGGVYADYAVGGTSSGTERTSGGNGGRGGKGYWTAGGGGAGGYSGDGGAGQLASTPSTSGVAGSGGGGGSGQSGNITAQGGGGTGIVRMWDADDLDRASKTDEKKFLTYRGEAFTFDYINPSEIVANTAYITSNTYQITKDDYYIGVNVASTVTITLPPAADIFTGREYYIKDESGNAGSPARWIDIYPSGLLS